MHVIIIIIIIIQCIIFMLTQTSILHGHDT